MNSQRLRIVSLTGIVISSLFAFAPAVLAQSLGVGLQVKPAIIEDNVQLGQKYQFSVTVTNKAATERTFIVSAQDITGLDDQGLPVFAAPGEATSYSLSQWIILPQTPITLAAGASADIPFSVQVPTDASPGAHFGGVFFDTSGAKQAGNASAVNMKVGAIISLQIAGNTLEDARLREFSSDKFVYSSPQVAFSAKIENLGNVLLRPHGILEITDMFGKKVDSITVNDAGAPIFPGSSRTYMAPWQYGGFAFGRYQALLSVSYGSDAKRTITAETAFWVLPLGLIGTVLGSLVAIVLLIYVWIRVYLKRKLEAMGATGKGADASYYGKKYNKTGSRLIFAIFALVLLCVLLLAALFFMFA